MVISLIVKEGITLQKQIQWRPKSLVLFFEECKDKRKEDVKKSITLWIEEQ